MYIYQAGPVLSSGAGPAALHEGLRTGVAVSAQDLRDSSGSSNNSSDSSSSSRISISNRSINKNNDNYNNNNNSSSSSSRRTCARTQAAGLICLNNPSQSLRVLFACSLFASTALRKASIRDDEVASPPQSHWGEGTN